MDWQRSRIVWCEERNCITFLAVVHMWMFRIVSSYCSFIGTARIASASWVYVDRCFQMPTIQLALQPKSLTDCMQHFIRGRAGCLHESLFLGFVGCGAYETLSSPDLLSLC